VLKSCGFRFDGGEGWRIELTTNLDRMTDGVEAGGVIREGFKDVL
jgi:hypothetical protein